MELLGRNPSFDPKTDPIVRAEAARLRTRLETYYNSEGTADLVRIAMPKGGYAPEFSEQKREAVRPHVPHLALLLAAGALLGGAAVVVMLGLRKPLDTRDTLRLSVLPPRGASIESSVISPDGRRIAFTAIAEDGKKLWVRELDSLEAKALAGTEDASLPFWSPDSHALGFFHRNEVKVIQISGGPAKTIASARIGLGGAWSSRGIVVFPPWPSGGLLQVSADGGTGKVATTLDPSHSESAHRFPAFLPDGRHFLFLAVSSRPAESSIRVGSLDSTSSKRLLNADGAAVYAPNPGGGRVGYLLYLYSGGIMAQLFDTGNLELSGMPVPVAPEIASSLGRGDLSVSKTGVLAYRTAAPKHRQLAWVDRDGRPLQTLGPRNSFYTWSLSPDEKRIAIQDELRHGSIWTMDLDHDSPTLLASDARAAEFFPIWSPAGSEILFSKNQSGPTGGELVGEIERQALTARTAATVLGGPGPKFLTDWSSDGRFVAYFTPWPEWKKTTAYIASLRGPDSEQVPWQFAPGPHSVSGACFSPDSDREPRWVAYTSNETGRDEVYVGSFPHGEQKWRVSTGGGWQPHWRHDGRELFYVALDGNLMAVEVKPGSIFRQDVARALFPSGIRPPQGPPDPGPGNYAVSRNGRSFLINQAIEDAGSAAITVVTPWVPK
ncbi:MAG: hypothetical protein LAQ69_25425 [Acidobacteriia bacterium]|nr:hypothetical protein [Terriglobia bacterium]